MVTTEIEEMKSSEPSDEEMEAMLTAGVHLGHNRSRRHPAMAPYLWGVRGNVEIIDLTKTKEKLQNALAFLNRLAQERKLILFVGTRPSARELVKAAAEALGYPYVTGRWIGGTLTNFKVILKRIEILEGLETEQASGGFEKYTKKERLVKGEEMEHLRENFDGLRKLRKLPDAVVVLDIGHDEIALNEANRMKIPVVSLTDTNTDPRKVLYPIPSNDDARPAISYMLSRMEEVMRKGQQAAVAAAEAAAAAAVAAAETPRSQ